MLTIKNIENTKQKEFSFLGNEWVLYGVDVNRLEYKFIFMPKENGSYNPQRAELVILDRNKKIIDKEVLGYRLWTTYGTYTYVNKEDIQSWTAIVHMVYENKMI